MRVPSFVQREVNSYCAQTGQPVAVVEDLLDLLHDFDPEGTDEFLLMPGIHATTALRPGPVAA